MIVIGAVLLVLAVLAAAAAVGSGRDVQVHLSGLGVDSTTSVLWVFCAGAVTMLLLALSFAAFRRVARRRRQQRRELKQLRADEAAAAETRAANGGRDAAPSGPAEPGAVDVREPEAAPAHRADADDPGPERRYVPGEERVT